MKPSTEKLCLPIALKICLKKNMKKNIAEMSNHICYTTPLPSQDVLDVIILNKILFLHIRTLIEVIYTMLLISQYV